jgi:SLOG-like protein
MVRDGVGFRVPVRQRSRPWRPLADAVTPRPIDLDESRSNIVIAVFDDVMSARQEWARYLGDIQTAAAKRGRSDLLVMILMTSDNTAPTAWTDIQAIRAPAPTAADGAGAEPAWSGWLRRVMLDVLALGVDRGVVRAGGDPQKICVFLSHAKADGENAALLMIAGTAGADLAAIPELQSFFSGTTDNGLAAMRRTMTRDMDARIIMGGAIAKTAEGRSGVVSEALAALDAGKPLLILGGVGGSSRDVAFRLGLIDESDLVYRDVADYVDKDGIPSKDRFDAQLQEIAARRPAFERAIARDGIGDELRRLAISDSHIEIGALVMELLDRWLPQTSVH